MLLLNAKGGVRSGQVSHKLTICQIGFPHLTAGKVTHIVEIVYVNAGVKHLDEISHKSTVDSATACSIIATDENLIKGWIIASSMLYL